MYIIAIAWLWVAFMMAIAETGVVAGILTFVFYGLLPTALIVYLMGTPARRRRQREAADFASTGNASRPGRESDESGR